MRLLLDTHSLNTRSHLARSAATPTWEAYNLRKHLQERLRENPGCFEDLLGLPPGSTMTESQYEVRSLDAVTGAWGEYEGEGRDRRTGEWKEARAFFVDQDLVVAITDGFRRTFITCFHEHFDYPHGVVPGPGASLGDRQLAYIAMLKKDNVQLGFIRRLKPIRGLPLGGWK
jgi:hypothetical protein